MRCGCFGASRTRKKERKPSDYISGEIEGYPLDNIRHFSDKELSLATDNYHLGNKIGRGGFGTVYQVFRLLILQFLLKFSSIQH